MAETTQFVSRISVKDLISAFESKSETVRVEFSRPRARSFGNVLNKNVIVRLNEFITLEDIEKGLIKLETDLNFYEVYNKAKHVAFQEQFFNILTSIANIENEDEDAPLRKKRLISRTQTLVSFLNQKLPSNINQVIEPKQNNQFKYVNYAAYTQANSKVESDKSKPVESQISNDSKVQPSLYVESSGTVDIVNSGKEYLVSVKKLKENFQQKSEEKTDEPIKPEKIVKVNQNVNVTTNVVKAEQPKPEIEQTDGQSIEEKVITREEKAVSVTKLRSLFEQRSSTKGLEIITVDKSQLNKNTFGGSVQNISNIPYTERNLGTFRLQRSVSGNYMNYSGLLKRVDINRSSSVLELNRDETKTIVENNLNEDSGTESDGTLENQNAPIRITELIEKYSSAIKDNQEATENKSGKGHIHIINDSDDIQVKYSSSIEHEENDKSDESDDNEPNESKAFSKNENVSNLQDLEEEEVNYSNAVVEDVSKEENNKFSENESSLEDIDDVEVNSSVTLIKNVEKSIGKQEAVVVDAQPISITEDSGGIGNSRTTEHELSYKGFDEEEVNIGSAFSENLRTEENVAKFEAAVDEDEHTYTSEAVLDKNQSTTNTNKSQSNESHVNHGIDNHINENNEEYSSIFSLHDLEDERERSLIEEVINEIDIDQTLANADLVVNPEDLKNADDEFEKLIEGSVTNR